MTDERTLKLIYHNDPNSPTMQSAMSVRWTEGNIHTTHVQPLHGEPVPAVVKTRNWKGEQGKTVWQFWFHAEGDMHIVRSEKSLADVLEQANDLILERMQSDLLPAGFLGFGRWPEIKHEDGSYTWVYARVVARYRPWYEHMPTTDDSTAEE